MSRTIRTYQGWNDNRNRKQRDKKPWFKPDGEFKKLRRRQDRAFQNQLLREGKDVVNRRRRNDVWDWN